MADLVGGGKPSVLNVTLTHQTFRLAHIGCAFTMLLHFHAAQNGKNDSRTKVFQFNWEFLVEVDYIDNNPDFFLIALIAHIALPTVRQIHGAW